jgi:hypothetical protein
LASVTSIGYSNDVSYIITPDERAAFLKLGTNEEREQFVEHFFGS